ncbi:MAG: DegQ family serine endoprotease [Nitrospinota bacterium]
MKDKILKNISRVALAIFILTSSIVLARYISTYIDRKSGHPSEEWVAEPFKATAHSFSSVPSGNNFVDIVKEEKPAVVNIFTTQVSKHPGRKGFKGPSPFPFGEEDPFRDFFDRFFGEIPPQEIPRQSLGSGFIIDSSGHILTNNHVIDKAEKIKVTLGNGKEYDAKLIGTDSKTDIALIKIDAKGELPVIRLGDSDTLEVGEWVIAIGNPFGVGQSVTAGIVSAKGRVIGAGPYDDFIQTDASINPGNSGGPLINTKGEVVGINTAIFTAGGAQGNIGIGFAIPINVVKPILKELKEKGVVTRGWLGVMIQKITPEIAKSFNLTESEGALVGDVVKGGPADKVGLKRGDVIVEFDGKKIKSVEDLPRLVAVTRPETKAEVIIIRDGSKKKFMITIGTLKEEKEMVETKAEGDLGLSVQNITPEIAQQLNLDTSEGVVIMDVNPTSLAFAAGVRRGYVIIEINRKEIKDLEDYKKVVENLKGGDMVILLIRDGKSTRYIPFTLPKE